MALNDAAIVAFAETKIEPRAGRDIWELGAEILSSLIEKAGIDKAEIDGLLVNSSMTGAGNCFWSQTNADYFGLELDFCQTVDLGGSSAVGAVARAAAALDAGLCTTILLLNADTEASERNINMRSFHGEWEDPYGLIGPPADFGLISQRYDHLYGLDQMAMAKLAVTQRNHALMNDNACDKLRKPISVDDYLGSRVIADPIKLLDCVMVCDGANGMLMTTKKRAREKGFAQFAVPLGYGERSNYRAAENLADITESGHLVAGKRAFAQAGLEPRQIASFHPYDDFLIAIMLQMEMLGFAPRGQGCAFINEVGLGHDGDLPLNTGGGQISAGQAGLAGGGTNLVEAVRQLFGEGGARQVSNRSNALVTGIGWIPYARNWGTSAALILGHGGVTDMSELMNDTLDVQRPVPRTFSFTKPYWDATRDKKVMLQYCRQSGQYQFFPKPVSVFTGGTDLEWREVSGKGEVFSYTVARIGRPPFAGATPYLIATITLDEGVNMMANVIGCTADEIRIGMRVRPAWIPLPDGTNVLVFERDVAADQQPPKATPVAGDSE